MKERVKGREREGRKGERNEYDLRRGLLKNTLWDMYCYLHLKDGTTPRFADEFSVTERVCEVENQVCEVENQVCMTRKPLFFHLLLPLFFTSS